ncbi:MAG: glycosyltransferase family 4 protein [Thainema sp.]
MSKLLLISGVYPPAVGGPSLQTKQIAQGLMAQGMTVQVATYGHPQHSGIWDGVPITFLDSSPQPHWSGKLRRNLGIIRQLNRLIHQQQPDVIHMQTAAGNLALMTGLLARWHRIPSLLKYTADLAAQKAALEDFLPTGGKRQRFQAWMNQLRNEGFQRLLFKLYTAIWATTPAFHDRLVNYYQVPLATALLWPNFIDLRAYTAIAQRRSQQSSIPQSSQDRVELLTVARLFPVKGLDVYLRALAQLSDLPIHARIVGSGSATYQRHLEALAAELGLGNRLEFTGAIAPEQVAAAYATADLFILPSRHEPFGIVLIEAMAAGIPIVATNVDGIPNVVQADGQSSGQASCSALLVPPEDADQLAIAIRSLISSPEQRQAFAIAGQIRAQQFALDQGLQALQSMYQRLIASLHTKNQFIFYEPFAEQTVHKK